MKSIFKSLVNFALIFSAINTGSYANYPILVVYKKDQEFALKVRDKIFEDYKIPKDLIGIKKYSNECVAENVVLQICLTESNQLETKVLKKEIIERSFSIFKSGWENDQE